MTILDVLYIPNDILLQKSIKVELVNDDIRLLLDNMVETMYANNGIGLAANQIGELKRVCVVDVSGEDEDTRVIKMVNPEIVSSSEDVLDYEEGCLSIPTGTGVVTRPKVIKVKYQDENGEVKELDADGLLSTCIQHEVDHLDGILFIDYLSKIKRDMIKRKVLKFLKK